LFIFKTIYGEKIPMKIKITKQNPVQTPQSTREAAILALRELKKYNMRDYKRKNDAKH
tara:strand:- start:410 stop:583 length:174 start_codon:yes stop_codon:yes gene_type:complete